MLAQYQMKKAREDTLARVLAWYRNQKGKSHSMSVTQYHKEREESLTEVLLSTAFRTFDAVEHVGN